MLITQPIHLYIIIVAISHFSGLLVGLLLDTSSRVALFSLIHDVIQKIKNKLNKSK